MNSYRTYARFAGAMYLVAMVASIGGGLLIESTLHAQGADSAISEQKWILSIGSALELVNALAVIGIAAAMWIPLSRRNPAMAVGYLGVRILEAAACAAAAFIPVVLLRLADQEQAELLIAMRGVITAHAVPIFLGVGAILLYTALLRSGLVPRYLAVWGLVAAPAVIIANTLATEPALMAILVLPILTNEIYLGVYLLTKGFRSTESALG